MNAKTAPELVSAVFAPILQRKPAKAAPNLVSEAGAIFV